MQAEIPVHSTHEQACAGSSDDLHALSTRGLAWGKGHVVSGAGCRGRTGPGCRGRWGLGAGAGWGPGSRQSSECFAFRLPSCSPAAQGGGIAGGSHSSFCRLWVFAQVHGDPTLGFMK